MQKHCRAALVALTVLVILGAAGAVRAASVQEVAWALADKPTNASYTPSVHYNSTGGNVAVLRSGAGEYEVSLTGFTSGTHDDMQITAVDTTGYCNSYGWSSGAKPGLSVRCFATDGTPTDLPFTILYQKRQGSTGSAAKGVAFLWADQDNLASYTPYTSYQYNSTGGTNTVTRSGVGAYTAHLPGLTKTGGHVQVTGYMISGHCGVKSWKATGSGTSVQIACVDVNGDPADSKYDLAYSIGMTMGEVGSKTAGLYVLAGKSTARHDIVTAPEAFNDLGGPTKVTISRTDTGRYSVKLPTGSHKSVVAFVTAYDSGDQYCNVGAINTSTVTVACIDEGGGPADNDFDLTVQARK